MKTNLRRLMFVSALTFSAGVLHAETTESLGDELTPLGAIRAGNSDGSIPAWTGGMTAPPKNIEELEGARPDPFVDEEPLFTITAENYESYQEFLTKGQVALLKRYSDSFEMPVYPTHRTAAAPEWVYSNTRENAVSAKLVDDGNGVDGAANGIPFPLADSGIEVIWNHLLRWQGEGQERNYSNLTVFNSGSVTVGGAQAWADFPYYEQDSSQRSADNSFNFLVKYELPVRRKGEVTALNEYVRPQQKPREAWQYIPGQRRVRRAPTIGFDNPNPSVSGLATYDDTFMYAGSPERYDWKLLEKRELIVPYNNNRMLEVMAEGEEGVLDVFTPKHPNPEYARWELHRVWVVEANLKEEFRHTYPRRVFYIDEDSWSVVSSEAFDSRGNLWRVAFATMLNAYDVPATVVRATWHVDLEAGAYGVIEADTKPVRFYEGEAASFFTPSGVRQMSRR